MTKEKLAILGGPKTIPSEFKRYNSIGIEEVMAATKVIESGVLSKFLGAWHEDFYGGPKVREFEAMAAKYFGVKHAITVNSWTSGLIAAVGAIGVEPGDELIVTPWTMCASATSIIHWNAIPVFADIDPDTFTISPESIEKNITERTKAIIVVDIFGQSADIQAISSIAKKHNLKIIGDTAQAPGTYSGKNITGTLVDIGGYSLNYHKHIHTGEGGILITNDDNLAERLQLIRNHGEAVVGQKGVSDIANIIGYNFRLGEIECAIGLEQLKKLDSLIQIRQSISEELTQRLMGLMGLRLPYISPGNTHAYYIYGMIIDTELLGVSRKRIKEALTAEGVPGLMEGYVNLHLLPMFQKKIAYGTKGFPWVNGFARESVSYEKGICPVAEDLHDRSFMGFLISTYDLTNKDVDLIGQAFKKVWQNMDFLK